MRAKRHHTLTMSLTQPFHVEALGSVWTSTETDGRMAIVLTCGRLSQTLHLYRLSKAETYKYAKGGSCRIALPVGSVARVRTVSCGRRSAVQRQHCVSC